MSAATADQMMDVQTDDSEARLVHDVTTRVRSRFPQLPQEVIDAEVAGAVEGFADARVRDLLPILVERETVARLKRRRPVPSI